jgi:serine/threonine-protein kinase
VSASGRSLSPAAVDLADGLLCALVLADGASACVAPLADAGAEVRALLGERLVAVEVTESTGRALVVRLSLLAGLDPWAEASALGRLLVRVGAARAEFAVGLTPGPSFPVLEVRRLAEATAPRPPASPVAGASIPPRIGPYLIEGELGRGAMGIVYRARREGQGRPVAVKLLNPSIASDPAMSARFAREGQAAARVNDPGVVGVTDFAQLPDGQAYLVMEIVEGRTLEDVLEQSGALPPAEAVRIAVRILAALEAAHVRGVVHRDLKPSNVFLAPGGQVKIADFGAALVADTRRSGRTDAGLVLGSPAYMAPEQALGRPTDDRADLYSLGCVLYRMLSGRPPFRARTLVEVLRQQIEETPEPVSSPHAGLPVVLVEAVERALAKSPDERFRSAGEMRAVLELALARLGGGERREGRR